MLATFGSAVAALDAVPALARRGGAPLTPASRASVERELDLAARLGASLVVWGEPAYPPLLAEAPDAPSLLTCLGSHAVLARPCVAIVGARNASANGQRFAEALARDLAAVGWIVVSGLARGIDSAAHRGAGPAMTVAVQAGGVDVVYPPENAALHAAIAREGAVVGEMPIGLRPQARHFPRRNRIVSGLSAAVVVVEATARSGSLITARNALDQGRPVLAVPGSPLDPRSAGPNALIRDGATLVTGVEDVLAALASEGVFVAPLASGPPAAPRQSQILVEFELDDARRAVLESLGPEPTAVDELLRRCHLSAPVAQMVLLEMELAGRVQRHPGNQVSLVI